jgi:hypothetical protein
MAGGMRRSATRKGMPAKDRKPVDKCATYLRNKTPYLRYDSYLSEGLPIGTGVIEGACRHLVKDRMEITGAKRISSRSQPQVLKPMGRPIRFLRIRVNPMARIRAMENPMLTAVKPARGGCRVVRFPPAARRHPAASRISQPARIRPMLNSLPANTINNSRNSRISATSPLNPVITMAIRTRKFMSKALSPMGLARLFPVVFNTISIPAGGKIGNLFPSPVRVPGQTPQTVERTYAHDNAGRYLLVSLFFLLLTLPLILLICMFCNPIRNNLSAPI